MTATERLLDALSHRGCAVKANGVRATAQCPAHEDRSPSLSLTSIEGQVLVYCHAGCETTDVLASLGLAPRDLYDEPRGASYSYTDRSGSSVLRTVHRTPDKRFSQNVTDKSQVPLYRLPAVVKAVEDRQLVYVVEGEKDCHALESLGVVATTAPMGASNAAKADWAPLHGARVILVADRDQAGDGYARAVLESLTGQAEVRIVVAKVGKDATDHVAAGYGVEDFQPHTLPAEDESADLMDAAAEFARAVERQSYDIRVREAARAKVTAENTPEAPPFDAGLLVDVLARPAEPPDRAEGLIPTDAGTLVVAQRKTGKTTWELNLARSLILGGDFLGRFGVRPIQGRVGFLNFEVGAGKLARWAQEAGVPAERLFLVNLRGRRNPFGNDADRERLSAALREHDVESLIVDPFGRAYVGKSQNDPGEVGAWLADLDRFARGDCGVSDVVLSAHAGWDGERTRGASALEDWADVVVTIARDRDDDQVRYLRAEGRDVLVDEDRLEYDAATRSLRLLGAGSRKVAAKTRHLDELVPAVTDVVTTTPGITGYKLGDALRDAGEHFQRGDHVKAARLAVERGWLRVEDGPRNSKMYFPADLSRPIPTYPNGDRCPPIPTSPYGGGVGGTGQVACEPRDRSEQLNDTETLDSTTDIPAGCPSCLSPLDAPPAVGCGCADLHGEVA